MSYDDFDEDEYEKETKELGMVFWISLILGFAFPLVWFLTAVAFYDVWEWENKKEEYKKKNRPKIGFLQRIKNKIIAVFDGVIAIIIIGIIVFLFFQ